MRVHFHPFFGFFPAALARPPRCQQRPRQRRGDNNDGDEEGKGKGDGEGWDDDDDDNDGGMAWHGPARAYVVME